MTASKLPWFRLWTDIIDDEKIRMLAFEDRWHFVALMSLKRSGFLDRDQARTTFRRGLEIKLGVTGVDLDNLKLRLMDVDLIGPDWSPISWDARQAPSDSSTERVRKFREKNKKSNETADETFQKRSSNALELEGEEEEEKNKEQTKEGGGVFGGADEALVTRYLQRRKELNLPNDSYGLSKTRRILDICQTDEQRNETLENSLGDRYGHVYQTHLPDALRFPVKSDKPTLTATEQLAAAGRPVTS